MKAPRERIILFCLLALVVNADAQDARPSLNQLRINELAREAAKLKQQLKEKTDEIQRIVRANARETLVVPGETEATVLRAPEIKKDPIEKLADVVKLRQTLKDPALAELPAKLSYTQPADGNNTIAIDSGVDVDLFRALNVSNAIRQTTKLDAFAEYHKNSGSTPPVDTLLIGVQSKHNLGRFDLGQGFGKLSNWIAGDASFKRDDIVSGKGFFGEIFYYPYNKSLGVNSYQSFKSLPLIEYLINPNVGFQYETGNGASTKFTSGDRVSFRAALTLTVDPFPKELNHRLEWSNTISWWSHMTTSGGFNQYDRNQYFYQSSLNLYFDTAKQVALGVDYTNGDNLNTNQFDTNSWTLSFKAKLGK